MGWCYEETKKISVNVKTKMREFALRLTLNKYLHSHTHTSVDKHEAIVFMYGAFGN